MSETRHATCVAIGGRGVLLTGPPGAGKSDLALRLLDRGHRLVSDDGVLVEAIDGRLIARAPATIAGKLEVRGVGIVERAALAEAAVALIVALDARPARMPEEPPSTRRIAGIDVPVAALDPFEPSSCLKLELLIARL